LEVEEAEHDPELELERVPYYAAITLTSPPLLVKTFNNMLVLYSEFGHSASLSNHE
jgi:hypothetical protein